MSEPHQRQMQPRRAQSAGGSRDQDGDHWLPRPLRQAARWLAAFALVVIYAIVTFVATGGLVEVLPHSLRFAPMLAWAISLWLVSKWARRYAPLPPR